MLTKQDSVFGSTECLPGPESQPRAHPCSLERSVAVPDSKYFFKLWFFCKCVEYRVAQRHKLPVIANCSDLDGGWFPLNVSGHNSCSQRHLPSLSKSLGYVWEKVSSMLCSQKMLLWRCLKNTKPYNISIWEAGADWGWLHGRPQKMVRGSAKCKSKGVPWNTNIASNVWILHLSFSFLRTT